MHQHYFDKMNVDTKQMQCACGEVSAHRPNPLEVTHTLFGDGTLSTVTEAPIPFRKPVEEWETEFDKHFSVENNYEHIGDYQKDIPKLKDFIRSTRLSARTEGYSEGVHDFANEDITAYENPTKSKEIG